MAQDSRRAARTSRSEFPQRVAKVLMDVAAAGEPAALQRRNEAVGYVGDKRPAEPLSGRRDEEAVAADLLHRRPHLFRDLVRRPDQLDAPGRVEPVGNELTEGLAAAPWANLSSDPRSPLVVRPSGRGSSRSNFEKSMSVTEEIPASVVSIAYLDCAARACLARASSAVVPRIGLTRKSTLMSSGLRPFFSARARTSSR